jgi:hypothetical protein
VSDPTASANEEGRPVENEAAFSTRSDHDTEARIADGDATDARHAAVLSIPELDADVDNLTAALAYADAGIYILPVKRGTKNPGSIVGRVWQDKSSRDIEVITAWFAGTDHGIAIDLGRSGLVVIDVDRPEMQPEWLQNVLSASGAPLPRPPGRIRPAEGITSSASRRAAESAAAGADSPAWGWTSRPTAA